MMTMTPPESLQGRNAAHSGPAFLPWHRYMMIVLEKQLQRVLEDSNFGLPYWSGLAAETR
jgi:tyrosinase